MNDDPRCCGSGTCIINPEGRCWCGQQWDGEKMCQTPLTRHDTDQPTDKAPIQSAPDARTP